MKIPRRSFLAGALVAIASVPFLRAQRLVELFPHVLKGREPHFVMFLPPGIEPNWVKTVWLDGVRLPECKFRQGVLVIGPPDTALRG